MEPTQPAPTERTRSEREFYNRYATHLPVQALMPSQVFAPTCRENTDFVRCLGEVRGKRVLDIGCGQGDTSVWFALQGAEVWALDISDEMVRVTEQLAAHHGVGSLVHGHSGRVEDMQHPDGFFDVVFADGVLHHLDMRTAVPNIVRVLKPGGRGFFFEPQKGSLLIELYRLFARDLRTKDERPLEPADFTFLQQQFGQLRHQEYHLISLFLFGLRFLQLRLSRRAYPYWMDEVRQGKFLPGVLGYCQKLDAWLIARLPSVRRWCWLTVIEGRKQHLA